VILTLTVFAQRFIYYRTLSVALLADLIHKFGDALTDSALQREIECEEAAERVAAAS